jgi:hypothetical protein
MVYNTQNYWVFGLFPLSGILENTAFRKLDQFPSSGEGGGEYGQWRMETDPVSETSYSLEYQMMEKDQKPSNSEDFVLYPLCWMMEVEPVSRAWWF